MSINCIHRHYRYFIALGNFQKPNSHICTSFLLTSQRRSTRWFQKGLSISVERPQQDDADTTSYSKERNGGEKSTSGITAKHERSYDGYGLH